MRSFESADLPAVHRLICATIDACYPASYPPLAIEYFKDFHTTDSILKRAEEGMVLVAEEDGEIVATGALVGGEVSGVFVSLAMQGSGIGTVMMEALEQAAAEQGRASVRLYVSLPSQGFYEHLDYRMLEEGSLDVGDGQSLDYWIAEKSLGGS
jgi:GNAT superfamily N-acetyltransferase